MNLMAQIDFMIVTSSTIGIVIFIGCLMEIMQIIRALNSRRLRWFWFIVTLLITIFIGGYAYNLISALIERLELSSTMVSIVYIFGSVFCLLILIMSHKTYDELQEVNSKQKEFLDHILAISKHKTEFMESMSHELRTPLNAIIGFTEVLLEGLYGEPNLQQKDFLRNINESATHLLKMVSNVLNIMQLEAKEVKIKVVPVLLKDLVEQARSENEPLLSNKGLQFSVSGLDDGTTVHADRSHLSFIISQLINNAVKFTEHGSVNITFQESGDSDSWHLRVEDTGIGIQEKDKERIFTNFQKITSPGDINQLGMGLGLSIVRHMVALHGGTVSFTSTPGKGSIFSITMPKSPPEKKSSP